MEKKVALFDRFNAMAKTRKRRRTRADANSGRDADCTRQIGQGTAALRFCPSRFPPRDGFNKGTFAQNLPSQASDLGEILLNNPLVTV